MTRYLFLSIAVNGLGPASAMAASPAGGSDSAFERLQQRRRGEQARVSTVRRRP